MEWSDQGFVLSIRPHGEGHCVADIFTREYGRWAGLVFGGAGRRMAPILQPGNIVQVNWRGRLADSLGHYSVELMRPLAAEHLMDRLPLSGLSSLCAIISRCVSERQPHPTIYGALEVVLDAMEDESLWPALMAKWELGLLADLGFGLTLDRCVSTGGNDELIYVSPKSASAVSASAGEPYRDRMLPLPAFFLGKPGPIDLSEAIDGLKTTGYFLETRILHLVNQQLPEARVRLIELLEQERDR